MALSLDVETHTHGSLHIPELFVNLMAVKLSSDSLLSVVVLTSDKDGVFNLGVQDNFVTRLIVQLLRDNLEKLTVNTWLNSVANSVLPLGVNMVFGVYQEMAADHVQSRIPMFELFNIAGLRLKLEAVHKFVDLLNAGYFACNWCNMGLALDVTDYHTVSDLCRHLGVSLVPLRLDVD